MSKRGSPIRDSPLDKQKHQQMAFKHKLWATGLVSGLATRITTIPPDPRWLSSSITPDAY